MLYYNARYYDSSLGVFLSPDTLVPDAGRVIDYNRFLYVRGNPLKYSDPSGHCAVTSRGERDDRNDSECWIKADSILNMWDDTEYWSSRWPDKEAFVDGLVYNSGTDADFFQWWLNDFFQSPEHRERYPETPMKQIEQVRRVPSGLVVGLGGSVAIPLVLGTQIGFGAGFEFVMHTNGERVILFVPNGSGGLGIGSSGKLYAARFYDADNAQSYSAATTMSADLTVSAGPIGITAGQFTSPEGVSGEYVGYAPGARLSIGLSRIYTIPLFQWNKQ